MFQGTITALVTPFKNNKVDYKGFENLINFQLNNKVDGILVCGCTGEAGTLTEKERFDLIELAIDLGKGKTKVIAGVGTNSTASTLEYSNKAKELGVDCILLITPYYNKPTQNGLYEHYKTIGTNVDIPIMLYNVPSRTGVNIDANTVTRLSKVKNIVSVKEASGSLTQMIDITSKSDIILLSGDDPLTLPILSIGGKGVVSVTSNIMPKQVKEMVDSVILNNDYEKARNLNKELFHFSKSLFLETNPGPVKYVLELMGITTSEMRMPLVPISNENKEKLKVIFKSLF